MNEDFDNLRTPEVVSLYEKGKSERNAVAYIAQLSGTHSLEINQTVYTLISDHILTEITIANAHRSGVMANVTMSEFRKAKKSGESYVISMSIHKTADTWFRPRHFVINVLFIFESICL